MGERFAPLAALAVLVLAGSARAGNPWNLRCASTPLEQHVPAPLARAAHAFSPWEGEGSRRGLGAGPVYLVAGSYRTAISRDGDDTDSSGEYLHRALVAVAPWYTGKVVVSGRLLGAAGPRTTLGFSTDGATRCTVHNPDVSCSFRPLQFARSLKIEPKAGWRIVRTELRIGRTGCFELTASGLGLHETIPLSVPGPDWGTSGW